MSFATLETILGSAVANAGTFAVSYPAGTSRGDFVNGVKHQLLVNQNLYEAPNDFTVAFGATTATITWNGGYTLSAGSAARLQFDMPGGEGVILDEDGAVVLHTVACPVVLVDLGNPVTSDDDFFRASASSTGTTALPLLQTTLDVPRNIIITSVADESAKTFVVTGTDAYGDAVVETITGANAGIAAGKKAFATVASVVPSATSAGAYKIGFGDVLGLPVHLPVTSLVLKEVQDSAAASAGTFVAGLSPLTKATATNADVRGTYDPNAACDGSKTFQLVVALPDATFKGVPQYAG